MPEITVKGNATEACNELVSYRRTALSRAKTQNLDALSTDLIIVQHRYVRHCHCAAIGNEFNLFAVGVFLFFTPADRSNLVEPPRLVCVLVNQAGANIPVIDE